MLLQSELCCLDRNVVVRWRRDCFFFFNDTATTEIYTLSLHDALPIRRVVKPGGLFVFHVNSLADRQLREQARPVVRRSEEHTSELQSRRDLVCRLLLEKKKKKKKKTTKYKIKIQNKKKKKTKKKK